MKSSKLAQFGRLASSVVRLTKQGDPIKQTIKRATKASKVIVTGKIK